MSTNGNFSGIRNDVYVDKSGLKLPSGRGYADIVYFPKRMSPLPALVIELKWNQSVKGAIHQIKGKNYPAVLSDYGGDILLVGISYEKDNIKNEYRHTCLIEECKRIDNFTNMHKCAKITDR